MIKVINVISDTNIGGAGKCLLAFLDNFDRSKFEVIIFLPKNSLLLPEIRLRDICVVEIDFLAEQSFNFKAIGALLAQFKRYAPNVVHCHAAMSGRIASKVYGTFYGKCGNVFTRHSVFDQPKSRKSFPLKQIFGFVNNFLSDKIIAVSPAAMENLTETGTDSKKIEVIFNGVDQISFASDSEKLEIRRRFGILPTDFVVGIIARLEPVKGHNFVLEAAKILETEAPDVKIVIAGAGSMEEEIVSKIAADHTKNVLFLGFIKDIFMLENVLDLQINASYGTEATSLSLLEGMSIGVPAVVSDFGGNPYVIKENVNGLVVPKKDAAALAHGILQIKNDHTLHLHLKKASIVEFNENYTSKKMAENIENLYTQIRKGV